MGKKDMVEAQQAMEGEQAPVRTTRPSMPSPMGLDAQQAVQQIREASDWAPNLAVMEIANVRTMNLHPAVAKYKVEMLEYLGTKL